MPRKRIISYESAGILISIRLSPTVIELLDLISTRDGFSGRSALIREFIECGISTRISDDVKPKSLSAL